jgi:hypothetical protein
MRYLLGLALLFGLVSAQENCQLIGRCKVPGQINSVSVQGSVACVSAGDSGVYVLDVTDPANPSIEGRWRTLSYSSGVDIDGDYAYVTDGAYFVILDISDPTNPTQTGSRSSTGWLLSVQKSGNYAYVSNYGAGLNVYDVSDPDTAIIVGACNGTGTSFQQPSKTGNYVCMSTYDAGMSVFDVSVPGTPVEVGVYSKVYGNCECVATAGDYAYLTEYRGVSVIDISDPDNPTRVGRCTAPFYVYANALSGNYVYVGASNAGLRVQDVSDPTDPVEVGYYPLTSWGEAGPLDVQNGYAYMLAMDSGLQVIQFDDNGPVFSDTLFVSPTGTGDTFTTIQAAVDNARPGYLVRVKAGTYNEEVTFPRSGTAEAPIVVRGDTNSGGEPVATLDNTEPIGAVWSAAPEIGSGVYKRKGYNPKIMLWKGNKVVRICDEAMNQTAGDYPDYGKNILNYDSARDWHPYTGGITTRFWPDVQMIFGVIGSETAYVRYVNRAWNPDTCDLRATESEVAAFTLSGRSYITLDHLWIQGYKTSIQISGGGNNTVSHCVLRNGDTRVYLTGGTASNTVKGNDMTVGYGPYALLGEWGDGQPAYSTFARRTAQYALGKYLEGAGSSVNFSIKLYSTGTGNVIDSNYIHDGNIGIWVHTSPQLTVRNNVLSGFASCAMYTDIGLSGLSIHDNDIDHNNISFRIGGPGNDNDTVTGWIYNNRCYNDSAVGLWLKWFGGGYDRAQTPNFWFYHNSIAGFEEALNSDTVDSRRAKMVNNIFSTRFTARNTAPDPDSKPDIWAAFDYNFCGGLYRGTRYQAWMFTDRHNQWATDTIAGDVEHQVWALGAEPNWVVPALSTAKDAALNLADSFMVRGVTYAALPGMTGYHADLGAWGQGDTTTPPAATYGALDVTSTPEGATVWIDAVSTDSVTPCIIDSIETGTRTVKLTLADYQDWTDDVSVVESETTAVSATMTPSTPAADTLRTTGGSLRWILLWP